jgi:hypothetical protein
MRWRHLRSGELDHERVWLAVSLCAVLIGWAVLASGLPTPRCMWHELTGLPCPGCGGTRCLRHLLSGRLSAAFAMNPLVFLGLASVALYDVYAAVVLAFRLPRLRIESVPRWLGNLARFGAVAALLANWAWLIARKV